MTQQLLSINIKLEHFLCLIIDVPNNSFKYYLMCFSSLSFASLKFNSSIQVVTETLFLVTVVSFKNTCWFFASNSRWPFLLYSSPAPFKPAESFSLVLFVLHTSASSSLQLQTDWLNRRRRWWRVANIWRQKLLVSCLSQAVWHVINTLTLWILLSFYKTNLKVN